jgi:hypothetical protein
LNDIGLEMLYTTVDNNASFCVVTIDVLVSIEVFSYVLIIYLCSQYYEDWAFIYDTEKAATLTDMAAGKVSFTVQ